MKKELLRPAALILAFLSGLGLLLAGLSRVYLPRDNTKAGGMDYIMANGYLAEGADDIDVFFVGSSEFYSGISPMLIWNQEGITSYDYAIGAQRTYNADVMVKKLLSTHHPKLVVLDGYVALKQGNPDEGVFAQAASWFPILDFHENWKKFGGELLLAPVRYTNREINKGFRPDQRHAVTDVSGFMAPSEERLAMPLLNRLYLRHIKALCDRAGVQVLVLALPSPENWDYAHHNALQAWADRAGISLVDLNLMTEELGIDPDTDYRDGGDHLNVNGAAKVSAWLGTYLKEQYGLRDRRGEEALAAWNEDWNQYPEW